MPTPMLYVTAALLAAACLPPLPRVVGFVGGGAAAGAALGMLSRRCLLSQWLRHSLLHLHITSLSCRSGAVLAGAGERHDGG